MSKKTLRKSVQAKKAGPDYGFWIGIGIAVVVVAILAFVLLAGNSPPVGPGGFSNAELAKGGHVTGNADSNVVVVEFSDFQCPACGTAYPAVKRLESEYGDRVQFVFRHFPLVTVHPNAVAGAEAAECAFEQGKFWEMHDALFENQSAWSAIGKSAIRVQAESIGLDMAAYDSCIASRRSISKIQFDMEDAVRFGVDSTPTFFVNGYKLSGFSEAQLKTLLESELAKQ